jgi:hypothetical protein
MSSNEPLNKCVKKTYVNTNAHINNDYLNNIYDSIYSNVKMKSWNKLEKVDSETMTIPKFNEYNMILQYNYNVQQLKTIISHHKLKISGNKSQLVTRIYSFLFLSHFITKIQKIMRGYLIRKYNKLHGPGFKNKSVCTNTTDFFTMDPLSELPNSQFYSFKDADGFIYGFDLLSIYNLIYKCDGQIKNPYNRLPISAANIEQFRSLLRLSRILKIPICTEIKDINEEISIKKSVELRALTLFQNIDALGNYSNAQWFLTLEKQHMIKMIRELMDIWSYRAPLTMETKRAICPPLGNPFGRLLNFNQLQTIENIDEVRKYTLEILEKFVNLGIDRDSKCLGAYYVLGALTLVSQDAATSLPWLYQAVCYM